MDADDDDGDGIGWLTNRVAAPSPSSSATLQSQRSASLVLFVAHYNRADRVRHIYDNAFTLVHEITTIIRLR